MMFSINFAVVLLLTFGINGQTNDINTFQTNNLEKGYPFGKLRLAEEGKNEELIPTVDIEKSQLNQDQSSGVQPLPSPCVGTNSLAKLAYPKDKTKYIQCRDEFHYEIFTCPNGGEYKEQTDSCDLILPMIDKCEQEKPCLNDGLCILLSNSTFKCNCRPDWTGDRCETPINSCVEKPCGPNAECRLLKTIDYEQDYVCVCHGTKGYGLNCQEVVPNPCLTTSEQFFTFAFSQHAYIQCDGDLVYFQPCGPILYWNQEDKFCDRKRPPKIDLPTLLMKYISDNNDNQQENNKQMTLTTTVQTEQQNSIVQNGKENEKGFAFVPARVVNRQQLQGNMNNQQDQLSQSNQIQQNFISKTNQWPNQQTESTMRQSPATQLGQTQPWSQNTQQQQQWTPMLTDASSINSNNGQSQFRQDNQQQNFSQQNQVLGNQQWSNQVPNMNTQNNQRFGSQSQSWQGSQTIQNQPQLPGQYQQTFFETTTIPQNVNRFQGYQNPNIQAQDQSWQNIANTQLTGYQSPQSVSFSTQNTQNFVPQSWQSSLTNQNQQTFLETTTIPQNVNRFQSYQTPNVQAQDQSWQNKPKTQLTEYQSPQSVGFNTQNTQSFLSQPQSWLNSQTIQNQPRLQDQNQQILFETTTAAQNVVRLPGIQNSNARTQAQPWQSRPNTQGTGYQSVGFNTQNTQNSVPQSQSWQAVQNQQLPSSLNSQSSTSLKNDQLQNFPQQNQAFGSGSPSWQGSQTIQNQPQFTAQSQQTFLETTTAGQNVNRFQDSQNPITQGQDQSWQKTQQIPQLQNQATKLQSNQIFAFQPKQWPDTSKQTQQSLMIDPSSEIQNTQFGFNQQFQPQGNQLTDSDALKVQTNQNFAARTFETTTTVPNKGINQGSRGWQPSQTVDQRQTLDSAPTLPGSWKSRSL